MSDKQDIESDASAATEAPPAVQAGESLSVEVDAGSGAPEHIRRTRAPPVHLDDLISGAQNDFEMRRGQAKEEVDLRKAVSGDIRRLFSTANMVVLVFIGTMACLDQFNLSSHTIGPTERLIDKDVILALLAATATQLGAVMFLMAKYTFRQGGAEKESDDAASRKGSS